MGNLALNGIMLYFITIALESVTGDYDDDWNQLIERWQNLSRVWKRQAGKIEYCQLAVNGAHKPHYHIIATSPIEPHKGTFYGLDVDCRLIGHNADDRSKLASYVAKNMKNVPHHLSRHFTYSRMFRWWANPALKHLARPEIRDTSVDVYMAQTTTKLTYKPCSRCGITLPKSTLYFQQNGKPDLRGYCRKCQKISDMVINANRTARHYGVPGTLSYDDIEQLFERARRGNKYLESDRGELLDYYDCVLDHEHPLSKNGANTIDNVRITSAHINSKKRDKTPIQWAYELHAMGIRVLPDEPVQKMLFTEHEC
jgi:5-methylcytosine-specific restriction endonuclease McrA